jgi:hypothetical protein
VGERRNLEGCHTATHPVEIPIYDDIDHGDQWKKSAKSSLYKENVLTENFVHHREMAG